MLISWNIVDLFGGALISLPLVAIYLLCADKERFIKNWYWVLLFVFYMNATLMIVDIPELSEFEWDPKVNLIPFTDFSSANKVGMILNIIMFIPFGGFLSMYMRHFRRMYKTVIASFLMSVTIEVLQLFNYRITDIDDVIMNVLGALIGYGIARIILINHIRGEHKPKDAVNLVGIIGIIMGVIILYGCPWLEFLHNILNI